MTLCVRSRSGWLVLGLVLLISALTFIQAEIARPSYGQFVPQTTCSTVTWTGGTWTGGTWTGGTWTGGTWTGTWQMPTGTWTGTWTGGTWTGGTWNPCLPHKRHGNIGLDYGWALSNMTIGAVTLTQPVLMNGPKGVRLGFIGINATSSDQIISNLAFNESVAQIEFDHNGSIQMTVESSVEPSQVFADSNLLSQAQSPNGLTPESEAWVYDPSSQTLMIFADPASLTLVYNVTSTPPTSSPVPEYPIALALILMGCLAITAILPKGSTDRKPKPKPKA